MGRRAEREAVEQVLVRARTGHSGALVVRGEAGIGKTALLEQAREAAASSGFRVESCAGVEAEAQFAFAGLHQLCTPMLGRLGALPDPQQAALGVAFGLRAGPAPDRFLVGLATLTLVAEVAEEAPLLCLVDDAQWLDEASAQVLAFVARRVSAERVALLFGVRDADAGAVVPFAGLPELRLDAVWTTRTRWRCWSPRSVNRSTTGSATRSSPRPAATPWRCWSCRAAPSRHGLAGGFELPDALKVPHRVEDGFRRRSAGLPDETQLLLLVAAADPTGEAALLWRAAAHLGIPPEAAAPAEQAGLLEIDTRVRFRHPLVRSAVYQAATPPDRRRAHGALAAATDPHVGPGPPRLAPRTGRAGHRRGRRRRPGALGRPGPRPGRAGRRSRVPAAGGRADPGPAVRARRALDAAQTMHEAGASGAALELLTLAGGPAAGRPGTCPGAAAPGHASPSTARTAARCRRCTSMRPGRSPRWTRRCHARPTSPRSTRRSCSAAPVAPGTRGAWPRPLGPLRLRPGRRRRRTCCSTGW